MDIESSVKYVKGVGEAKSELLGKLGVHTVNDLLHFYPRTYEDWSRVTPITETKTGEVCCIKARLIVPPSIQKRGGGKLLVKVVATDGIGMMNITFFNNKYVANQLHEGEEYLFYGKVSEELLGGRAMLSPKFAKASEGREQLRPVYRQTAGLSAKMTERIALNALEAMKGSLEETLPDYIIKKHGLMSLYDALYQMHFPTDSESFTKAKNRLIFEEFLCLQLGMGLLRSHGKLYTAVQIKEDFTQEFTSKLPFPLTNAQLRCIGECIGDMKSDEPMNRLLQGDVGSGKTAVAAALIYSCVKNGWQAALMAPTEVLAEQHARSLRTLLGEDVRIALLTGSVRASRKKLIRENLINGEIDLVIGTHAIIQDNVIFRNLGLVITDEQHRFGVKQRAKLSGKGKNPHTLVMSATPIPRTLGLIIYGDLDISVIDELPKGRQTIETYCVDSSYHQRVYNFMRKHVEEGRQVYVICPLVEESESEEGSEGLISAEEYSGYLQKTVFPDLKVGLIHGKMTPQQKDDAMRAFADGNTDILVATVVIEVGIDVPNAALMVIENAERFGLSQLHQLRGRIGRGQFKSTCVLISDAQNEESQHRLKVLCSTTDGFRIADEDLKTRGPGDFLGERQHGLPELKIANIADDTKELFNTKKQADDILLADPGLSLPEHAVLKKQIAAMFASLGNSGLN